MGHCHAGDCWEPGLGQALPVGSPDFFGALDMKAGHVMGCVLFLLEETQSSSGCKRKLLELTAESQKGWVPSLEKAVGAASKELLGLGGPGMRHALLHFF